MEFLNKIRDWVQELEEKDFFKYLIGLLVVLLLFLSFFVYRYYSKVWGLQEKITKINEIREDEIRNILTKHERVKKRKAEVDTILAKDEDFNIRENFDALLKNLRLRVTKIDVEAKELPELEKHIESELIATIDGINMKQLCQLLQELEKNERIYTKELDIKKSKKKRDAIDVSLTIATLLPKAT